MNPQTRKRQNLTAVYAALLQLMSQKPLSRISITELCQHAQVSRTYFYRNFANFDQIILAYQKQTSFNICANYRDNQRLNCRY